MTKQYRLDTTKPANAEAHGKWRITALLDERTGNSLIGIDFPHRFGGAGFAVLDDDKADSPTVVRAHLKRQGASLSGTKKQQIKFVTRLLKKAAAKKPLRLTSKPGLRDGGFVLGKRMLGTANGAFRWQENGSDPQRGEIGDSRGTLEDWQQIGELAQSSTYLTLALCASLGALLPAYVNASPTGHKPLVSEPAVFNLSGKSGSGKTATSRAAAGTFGPPELIAKWEFTRRGLEELAESRNDLLLVLDDTETVVEEGKSTLKGALRRVSETVPSGQSKHMAKIAADGRLPHLVWSTWGLTSSPKQIERMAELIGWKRSMARRSASGQGFCDMWLHVLRATNR